MVVESKALVRANSDVRIRQPLYEFAIIMENKLRTKDKDFPEGWSQDSIHYLLERLDEELDELKVAYTKFLSCENELGTERMLADIVIEAADVANFAMMIGDQARTYIKLHHKKENK
jgi:hypothetical protein